MPNKVQVVSFENPYPPLNGGIIDVFFLLKALKGEGVEIVLHSFYTDPLVRARALEDLCSEVFYYKRVKRLTRLIGREPFIVRTRRDSKLVDRINSIAAPVILEGVHTCSILNDVTLPEVPVFVRTHNVEHEYYRSLMRLEPKFFYRQYLQHEANKLEKFESVLAKANGLMALSLSDVAHFSKVNPKTEFVPVFHGNKCHSKLGKGEYVLYQGNLAVAENHHSAMFLINEVFHDVNIPFVIAGSNPRHELIESCSQKEKVSLISNPEIDQMKGLIIDAQINLLPSFTKSGIKLKLINALFLGRHCITNHQMLDGSALEECCLTYSDTTVLKKLVKSTFATPFDQAALENRQSILRKHYSDAENVRKLLAFISQNSEG